MKFDRKHRERIRHYILERIDSGQSNIARAVSENFGISEMTVYRYLRDFRDARIVEKKGDAYRLVTQVQTFEQAIRPEDAPREEDVYSNCIAPFIRTLPDNVRRIWAYAFTEMMNNVVDHANADRYRVIVRQSYLHTGVILCDNGIGIFRKIKDYFGFPSIDDAIAELFKGKLTTDQQAHSGEGIFFTSQLMDLFGIFSDDRVFTRSNFKDVQLALPREKKDRSAFPGGTVVFMQLSNFSNKSAGELFDRFTDDDGSFIRTRIPVKNLFDIYPVSRSQAKRLSQRLESFRIVELDFLDVSEIGQGFAHELFAVFQAKHPEIQLVVLNENEDIRKMINHVRHGSKHL